MAQKNQQPRNQSYSKGAISLTFILAIGIRYWLMLSKYQETIANHIEVSTPLNSWKRICEGLYLQSIGINPYEGDLLHETPLCLLFYRWINSLKLPVEMIFTFFDAATAIVLYFMARRYMRHLFNDQEINKKGFAEDSKEFLLSGLDLVNAPLYVAATLLFNPYSILNCVGCSTATFQNFFMAAFLCFTLHGWFVLSAILLAVCTTISFYPIVLAVPLFLYISATYKNKLIQFFWVCGIIFAIIALHLFSISFNNSFVRNVYGFILTVPDLQPNIGLFWYFFTEMFDHFRDLFISSFQINVTILYLIPLSIKFRKDPFLLMTALLFLITIFKSYPCVGDVGFVLSLLPCFTHLFSCSQQGFLVGVIYVITSILGPIMWHLWIYSNSANANFYFGVTLAFAIGQIFFVTDILFAYLKREFCLKHGKGREVNGKEALLVLE